MAYEELNHTVPLPSPIEAIRFVMDQKSLKQADLIPYIGSQKRVSEVLSGKRRLSLRMLRNLYKNLGIPAAVLIQETPSSPKRILKDKREPFSPISSCG